MPDVYATIAEATPQVVAAVGDAMELRARDPQQQAILGDYLARVPFPQDARVLEIGSGTGAIARRLATVGPVAEVLGVDPSAALVERARELSAGIPRLAFAVADGRALELDDASFDVVVAHTVISHVPGPERFVAEAVRVLRSGGTAVFFDGDYATATVAQSPDDPLQQCVDAFVEAYVNDRYVVRRLPAMLRDAGLTELSLRSHGFVQVEEAEYMLSVVDRGADALHDAGVVSGELATALKAEARRRVAASTFFGHIAYASLIARRP
jgi:ubiquinone/menaquinone biosynthesis C-methylase UbiE